MWLSVGMGVGVSEGGCEWGVCECGGMVVGVGMCGCECGGCVCVCVGGGGGGCLRPST